MKKILSVVCAGLLVCGTQASAMENENNNNNNNPETGIDMNKSDMFKKEDSPISPEKSTELKQKNKRCSLDDENTLFAWLQKGFAAVGTVGICAGEVALQAFIGRKLMKSSWGLFALGSAASLSASFAAFRGCEKVGSYTDSNPSSKSFQIVKNTISGNLFLVPALSGPACAWGSRLKGLPFAGQAGLCVMLSYLGKAGAFFLLRHD